MNAAILVLGDLNRSPRMLNHACAISEYNEINNVTLIGYDGGDIRSDVKNNKKINIEFLTLNRFNAFLSKFPKFLFIFVALIKIIIQFFYLFYKLLFKIPKPNYLILQNPPGVPTIFICLIVCYIRGTKFILDWHNYGYTILKVNNRNCLIVNLCYFYEKILGRFAWKSLCVSNAMKENLKTMGIDAITLPDRAMPGIFKIINRNENKDKDKEKDDIVKHKDNEIINISNNKYINEDISEINMKKENKLNNEKFCLNSSNELMEINEFIFKKYNSVFDDDLFYEKDLKLNSNEDGLMSEKSAKKLKKHRPLIFLSSTSWTPDEDFDILLNAVVIAEKNLKNYDQKIVIIITGRGPMKDQFFEKVSKLKLKIFQFKSIWLDSDDYPKILSMSDLGICLHYSSSGYDLPMKVVDMFSSGLPVLAVEYKTIHELVKDNINGFTFKNEEDLASLMVKVIQNYNNGVNDELNKFRENIENEFSKVNWITQWKNLLGCVLFKSKIN